MICREELYQELKKAQLSLVNETDTSIEIEHCWDYIPEKLTPGHRQRGSNKIILHCLPFRIKKNGKYIYSHWDGKQFSNPVPKRSPKLDEFLYNIANIYVKKKMIYGHVRENSMEVLHDVLLFLYERSSMMDLNKTTNPGPKLLFWIGNRAKATSKNYFSTGSAEYDDNCTFREDYSEEE